MAWRRTWLIGAVLAAAAAGQAGEPLNGDIKLPARWRGTRQVLQLAAEQAHFRFAVPSTVSRRAFVGSDQSQPVSAAMKELARQTGLAVEVVNGIVVAHSPNEQRRKELLAAAAGKDQRGRLAALCELGWLADAHAFPELARVAVGQDVASALAAAQALRRLDGEEPLDWRLYGVSSADPELASCPIATEIAPWQMPLGSAFIGCVDEQAVHKLAESQYIPLREAAGRLTPCLGDKGKALAEKLAADLNPIVRTAARRSLRAWSEPEKFSAAAPRKFDSKQWWQQPVDLSKAEEEIRNAKDHDTVWRTTGRKVGYLGTPESIKVLLDTAAGKTKWSEMVLIPLAEFNGGPEVVAYLRQRSDDGEPWAIWGLSCLQDGPQLAGSLKTVLETGRPHWSAPPEFTAARWAGVHATKSLLPRTDKRGHWVCLALGHIGGPEAVDALLGQLANADAGVAVSAAKGLGDAAALAGVEPLIRQLQHEDRLRRHWAVLGLGRIGGPEAAKALTELLAVEHKRKDRLVRKAAAQFLREFGSLGREAADLIAAVESDDRTLIPEYRPRNRRFDEDFPTAAEMMIPEHQPKTYCSIGETRVVMDWANRLVIRYGGCTGCYSNECFAFDVGSGTWFPIRAANHFLCWENELRTNAGCSRGMAYDGISKLVWIGAGIGMGPNPSVFNQGRHIGLSAYDAATDRFVLPADPGGLPKGYSGEPHKMYTFDYDAGLLIGSASGAPGVGTLKVADLTASLVKGPPDMPSMDHYPPPAFEYDPISQRIFCMHPAIKFRLLLYDARGNSFNWSNASVPAGGEMTRCGAILYDSLNREMILTGSADQKKTVLAPTCLYDRKADRWVALEVKDVGQLGGPGYTVFDPEHNVFLGIRGAAYRYKNVPVGTKAFHGGGISATRPE